MAFSRKIIRINTKITDAEQIKTIAQPIFDFVNKHDIGFRLECDEQNKLFSTCVVEGSTSAYCKGMVAEVQQMLKDAFKCKLDVVFYAY